MAKFDRLTISSFVMHVILALLVCVRVCVSGLSSDMKKNGEFLMENCAGLKLIDWII